MFAAAAATSEQLFPVEDEPGFAFDWGTEDKTYPMLANVSTEADMALLVSDYAPRLGLTRRPAHTSRRSIGFCHITTISWAPLTPPGSPLSSPGSTRGSADHYPGR